MTPGKHCLNSSCRQNGWELSFPSNNFQEPGAWVLHQFERVKRHLKNQFATSITGVGCKYWKHITQKSDVSVSLQKFWVHCIQSFKCILHLYQPGPPEIWNFLKYEAGIFQLFQNQVKFYCKLINWSN